MSKSVLLKSSIAKKYWMALTGLFLCLFLVGHLLGNLQLFIAGEEGRRAFNEYAYFMQHNPFIKVMSYVTYLSILFHAIDGIMLAVQNKKARPVQYAMNNAASNSSSVARKMAVLGTIILLFIVTHMVNFWAKMHFGGLKLHKYELVTPGQMGEQKQMVYYTHTPSVNPIPDVPQIEVKNELDLYIAKSNLKVAEGYKDLHSNVVAFFSGKETNGVEGNKLALVAVILYTLSMAVLSFHLMHGFSSAFQSLGIRHKRYTPSIELIGKIFAIVVPALFAIIPIYLFVK
ncbi:MAG: succinate dehydrogenase cytochrome b subunit [Fluviicola sp.]|jgi:succinate dehydrogenase / fumarate reductase cytochrome b subunit|nr:succinate dehydrogenase cytochrome b subunit [Fluviicola sp.]